MKLLWICPTLLHPTINGSQVRTLGILRHLRRLHEIHFVATSRHGQTSEQKDEYCTEVFSYLHNPPKRGSISFAVGALSNLFADIPLYIERYASAPAREQVGRLLAENTYDAVVVDFLLSAPNLPRPWSNTVVLFEHNVEARILARLGAESNSLLKSKYLSYMARKVEEYERRACMEATHVVAVSTTDAAYIEQSYGVKSVTSISTGVNLRHFKRPSAIPPDGAGTDIVFVGSMDYLPNVEGVEWFMSRVLPLIHAARPATTVGLVGKFPSASVRAYGDRDPRILVTGTVPDVRPYFWNAGLSIVPLLSGGGTRLKIYESMAAGTPVISTTVGAEGLGHTPGRDILIADDPRRFADACLELLENPERRNAIAGAGQRLVTSRFDWSAVAAEFDAILRCVCDKQTRARHDGFKAAEE